MAQKHVTEQEASAAKGWVALSAILIGYLLSIALMVMSGMNGLESGAAGAVVMFIVGIILCCVFFILTFGFFTLQPNEARVMVLFGNYKGTIKTTGFYWANPFYSRTLSAQVETQKGAKDEESTAITAVKAKISLRQRTLNGPKLKVNDKNGNPIEIANVMVWRVVDTARAVFDVDHYEQFVATQSETALRHVASLYAYDHNDDESEDGGITLRSNIIEVSEALKAELSERLAPAGIFIEDARLTHLAYAPEIAQVMLRRQQAEAIISARTKIVQGAVSMVDMAVRELDKGTDIALDDERKAAMVSNLMVVLCSDNDTQPIINTGTLYN
jgi:regulator of protease activity HflC (stomatin/prohibitin superfamily)